MDSETLNKSIAVIGVAFRLPGAIRTQQALWELLTSREDVIGSVPEGRWQWPKEIDPHGQYRGIDAGGFLDDLGRFDTDFFHISPSEAELMDPQQRLLLELSWECLEDAALVPGSLAGSKTAVFVGASGSDYRLLMQRSSRPIEPHAVLGTFMAVIPNRISYLYDFRGPSVQIDTACSSSLVAVHEAIRALRAGECTHALVGGSNIICDPCNAIAYYKAGILSKDGRCRTFDKTANGIVRSEGAIMVLLKRLSDALRDGDNIYCVLRGSAVSHGGRAWGLTVPNLHGQVELIAAAHRDAGVSSDRVSYVEAHGTGTPLGDPIEVAALTQAFQVSGAREITDAPYCALGSVKGNLGHLEAAAGLAGLLKVLLSLRHRTLPACAHFSELNPRVVLAGTPFFIARENQPWVSRTAGPLTAGISSFGFGGTNAHVIVEEFVRETQVASVPVAAHSPSPAVIVLSARDEPALRRRMEQLLHALTDGDAAAARLHDIAFTLQTGRESMEWRVALIASSMEELRAKLAAALKTDAAVEDVFKGHSKENRALGDLFGAEKDLRAVVESWLASGRYRPALELWVKGVAIDWQCLYSRSEQTPRRISLPGYAFAGARFWLSTDDEVVERVEAVRSAPESPASDAAAEAPVMLLLPAWERTAGAHDAGMLSPTHRVLICGGTDRHRSEIQARCPDVQTIHLNPGASCSDIASFIESSGPFDSVFWIASPASGDCVFDDSLIAATHQVSLSCFRLLKALLSLGYGERPLRLTVVTTGGQALHAAEAVDPAQAGVHALGGTIAKEQPRWQVRNVDLAAGDVVPLGDIACLPTDSRAHSWVRRGNAWFRRRLVPVRMEEESSRITFREGGVYVMIGGAGKIGQSFTEHLIRTYQAQVVWIGRRPENAAIRERQAQLAALGPAPHYIRADASSFESLEAAYQEIKARYSRIDAVIHAAVEFSVNSVAAMSEAEFQRTLASKVDTAVRMAQVFGRENLDFALLLSSLVTFIRNPGQGHYATACAFMDACAQRLALAWPCSVKVVNSGYWAGNDVGADEIAALRAAGVELISADAGAVVIERALGSTAPQLGFIRARASLAVEGVSYEEQALLDMTAAGSDAVMKDAQASLPPEPVRSAESCRDRSEMRTLLLRILSAQLAQIKPIARYERWLAHSLRLLREGGLEARCAVEDLDTLWQQWAQARSSWSLDTELHAQAQVVEPTLRQLPQILTGALAATDVMFADSSEERVRGIYGNNPVADYFNDAVAELASRCVQERAKQSRDIRILEIGAGTGATTERVLERLRPYEDAIREYAYTDLSPTFLQRAEVRFAAKRFVRYQVLDAERPPGEQGFEIAAYDMVIATNVLHATRRIHETLRNAKALLKRGGVLLLNELTRSEAWMHVSFGLLSGWWRHEDDELREPGGPFLSVNGWRLALQAEGFCNLVFSPRMESDIGQHLIAAESDGIIRQPLQPPTNATPATEVAVCASPAVTVPDAGLHDLVRSRVTEQFATALKKSAAQIRPDVSFADYGVDSISGVRIVQEINRHLGTQLPSTCLFDYSSVEKLTTFIVEEHRDVVCNTLRPGRSDTSAKRPAPTAPATETPAQTRISTLTSGDERIAIIGMSGRFPQCRNVQELWEHLAAGHDLVEPVTRWALPPETIDGARNTCSHGGFLQDVDAFDPLFFSISATEAIHMDPQQRLVLQESWHALEDAGYAGTGISGSRCSVYVGCSGESYSRLAGEAVPAQALWGSAPALLPARIAYHLNLQGPAITVDTACSSSLVALHLACQALRTGETDMALAGGVWVHCLPDFYELGSRAGMLSPTGHCYTFDARADGFVPAEGVGMVVLKRLSDALRDRDYVYGVVQGSGINQDGTTNGITAPSALSQERLECEVYDRFGIDAGEIQMVEAHGTGTALGDPIEWQALTRAFRRDSAGRGYCAIGSIKTNIGHTGAAAGVAGVIKVLLALEHEHIPPSLHFETPNPHIDVAGSPFYVNTELRPWTVPPGVRQRAAVSSFGIGGTNAHAVIEAPPPRETRASIRPAWIFPISAQSEAQLRTLVEQLIAHCAQRRTLSAADVSYTLVVGRRHHSWRVACVAADLQELGNRLTSWLEQGHAPGVRVSKVRRANHREPSSLPSRYGNECISRLRTVVPESDYVRLLETVAAQYVEGYDLEYERLFDGEHCGRVPLPGYPFANERYWISPAHQPPPASEPQRSGGAGAESYIRDFLSKALSLAPERFESHRSIFEYGVDSIVSVRLLRSLEEAFSAHIAYRELMQWHTLEALARIVRERAGQSASASAHALQTRSIDEALALFKDGKLDLDTVEHLIERGEIS